MQLSEDKMKFFFQDKFLNQNSNYKNDVIEWLAN